MDEDLHSPVAQVPSAPGVHARTVFDFSHKGLSALNHLSLACCDVGSRSLRPYALEHLEAYSWALLRSTRFSLHIFCTFCTASTTARSYEPKHIDSGSSTDARIAMFNSPCLRFQPTSTIPYFVRECFS